MSDDGGQDEKLKKNSRDKAPSFQFYPQDWLSDWRLMQASKNAKGVWIDLMCISFDMPIPGRFSDGNQTISEQELVNFLTGNRRKNVAGLNELIRLNIIKQDSDGTFYVKRIQRDMEIRRIRKEAGSKGGNPVLLKQKVNQNGNQNATPSSSSSISSSTSVNNKDKKRTPIFQKPTAGEVAEYALSIGYHTDGQDFIDHYESNGWLVGKNKMKDWRATVRTWKRRDGEFKGTKNAKTGSATGTRRDLRETPESAYGETIEV